MKFAPPFAHEGAVEVQPAAAGTCHCVSQTRVESVSGEAGAAVPSFATFIVTRRQAWPAGWQEPLLGQLTLELVTSRFGMLALVEPRASYVASPVGSVVELSWIASPFGDWPA